VYIYLYLYIHIYQTPPAIFQNPLPPQLSSHLHLLHSPIPITSPLLHLHLQQPHPSTPKTHLHRPEAQSNTSLTRIAAPQHTTRSPTQRQKLPTLPKIPASDGVCRANHLGAQHTHHRPASLSAHRPGRCAPAGVGKADAAERRWLARHEIIQSVVCHMCCAACGLTIIFPYCSRVLERQPSFFCVAFRF